jgi:dephospho-CoA kinase
MILGVTGGIASGKTLVTQIFRSLGAAVVSADELAREVVAPGSPLLERLVQRFGPQILQESGELDRAALGARIFADPEARAALNAITHPAIAALAVSRLAELATAGWALIVYEAPLLYEAGAEGRVDAVLVVTVPEAVQLQRLVERDGLSEAAARERIAAQLPQAEKAARADFVIANDGTPGALRARVKALYARLAAGSAQPENPE